ncbi:hypothetical protein GW17_00044817 [Ensete ventricosum]|nr:hypothetical protein GW17_00044817 [Ensete ventricosum]
MASHCSTTKQAGQNPCRAHAAAHMGRSSSGRTRRFLWCRYWLRAVVVCFPLQECEALFDLIQDKHRISMVVTVVLDMVKLLQAHSTSFDSTCSWMPVHMTPAAPCSTSRCQQEDKQGPKVSDA